MIVVGSLFEVYLGVPSYVPVIATGVVTLLYSTTGGLYISLLTDQIQAIFIWLLLIVVGIFIAINFRPGPYPALADFPPGLGVTEAGWGSFMTIGMAVISGTVFSDTFWQRVWSAKDEKSLMNGAYIAATLNVIVAFLFGFGGFTAAVYGLIDITNTNEVNSAFFGILRTNGVVQIPILTVVCLITVYC